MKAITFQGQVRDTEGPTLTHSNKERPCTQWSFNGPALNQHCVKRYMLIGLVDFLLLIQGLIMEMFSLH